MPTESVEFHDEATGEYDAAFDWIWKRSPDSAPRFDAEVDRESGGQECPPYTTNPDAKEFQALVWADVFICPFDSSHR